MKKKVKKEILIFLIAVSILTMLLSTALSNMSLKKGMPLPILNVEEGTVAIPEGDISSAVPVSDLAKIILIITVIVAFIIFAYKIIKKINWKDLTSGFIFILLIVLILISTVFAVLFFLPHSTIKLGELFIPPPKNLQWSPLGEAPAILILLIGFILAALLILLFIIIFKTKKHEENNPFAIELEAINAINEIRSGKDLKDVIIKCYHKMCIALQDEQEIKREEYMTVEEFEKRIEETGAPKKSIHHLTKLFEAVRYGNREPKPADEKEAIKCFNDIVQYFSEIRKDL